MDLRYSTILWITILNYLAITGSWCRALEEDLLDEYVRHIDNINKNHEETDQIPSNFHRKNSNNFVYDEQEDYKTNHRNNLKAQRRRRQRREVQPNQWTHSQVLDQAGNVVLRWQPRHQEILFRVEARTRGYVSIGFSPDGGKENADIVLGWVDDRSMKAYLLDCHGVPSSQGSVPVKDEIDNYTLMRGSQNDTHTILEFRRVLDTCDPDDYILTGDTVVVIWAYHDIDPTLGAEMIYHGDKRGGQSLHLLGPPPIPRALATGPNTRPWDVVVKNFEVRNDMNTIYWCKIFKPPSLQQKHHIVGYEPLIGQKHQNLVHHMILYECELNADEQDNFRKWDRLAESPGGLCYGPSASTREEYERCTAPMIAWAIGSRGENFPQHVGLPLAQKKKQETFYMLQIHFDNPTMMQTKDSSGLRLHYTADLRENDGGILTTGIALSTLHFIPPYQKEYRTAGYCSTSCTKEIFPKDGVHVVSVMLHSHLAGRKMKLRHIRGGKELQPLAQDDHYDFNYQQSRALSQDTIILPGDGLITECTYSTLNRSKPTLGGYSTKEEMCLAFVLHYPRTELSGCYSMSPIKYFFENLGVKEFHNRSMSEIETMFLHGENDTPIKPPTPTKPLWSYQPGDEMSPEANRKAILALQNAKDYTIEGESSEGSGHPIFDKLIIKEPSEFRDKSFSSHLLSIPYNETLLTKKMEEYFYTGLHLTFCRRRDDSLAIREDVVPFPNFTAYRNNENQVLCSYRLKRSSASRILVSITNFMLILSVTCLAPFQW